MMPAAHVQKPHCTVKMGSPGIVETMKKNLHPPYHQAKIHCACGHIFEVGSTKERLEVEICSHCHPFYTGASKIVDTAGRVEKFKRRLAKKKPA